MTANASADHPMRRLLSNRRGLLAGATALLGAGLAKLTRPDTAQAGVDGDVVLGTSSSYTGQVTAVENNSSSESAFAGLSRFIGVEGVGQFNAIGVRGASHAGLGISFNGSGHGVHGLSGSGRGVFGESSSGIGVRGLSTSNTGVWGSSSSSEGVLAGC